MHVCTQVSALCRERMHELVAEELEREGAAFLRRRQASSDAARSVAALLGGPPAAEPWSEQAEEERAWRAALMRSFRRADAMAPLACACGRVARPSCGCPLSASGAAARSTGIVGSTAVVAILVRGRLIVANCGDSRAVLCRGPEGTPPVPLSFDHKVCSCLLCTPSPATTTPTDRVLADSVVVVRRRLVSLSDVDR